MSKWDVAWRVQRCPAFFIWRGLSMSKIRKVSVEFEYDRDLAIAVAAYTGGRGEEATHEEMRRWFKEHGESCISDVSMECPDFEEIEEAS
jgi:hypothetical protein